MKPGLFILSFLFLWSTAYCAKQTDSLMTVLKSELAKRDSYDAKKEKHINLLRSQLTNTPATNVEGRYNKSCQLYEEYRSYKFDSAYVYTIKLFNYSKQLKSAVKESDTRLKLGFYTIICRMFKETFECFNGIDKSTLTDSLKEIYYTQKARAYADLGSYNSDEIYSPGNYTYSKDCLDSAIAIAKPNSYESLVNLSERQIRLGQLDKPSAYLLRLLGGYPLTEHQRAMAATGLSSFYTGPENRDERISLLMIGAINDIRSSTKETLAMFKLGQELENEGDIINAYTFIQEAMGNAQYYGARLRTLKIGRPCQ